MGSPVAGAEHFFLGMLHDGGWPVSVLVPLVDLSAAEAAVLAIVSTPGYVAPALPARAMLTSRSQVWGRQAAHEAGDSYLGAEHALIEMLRRRDTVPARALASLADLAALESAVLEAKNAPVQVPSCAVVLPEGATLDGPLERALAGILPRDATYGFNVHEGTAWLTVIGPDGVWTASAAREVINAALASLGRDLLLSPAHTTPASASADYQVLGVQHPEAEQVHADAFGLRR